MGYVYLKLFHPILFYEHTVQERSLEFPSIYEVHLLPKENLKSNRKMIVINEYNLSFILCFFIFISINEKNYKLIIQYCVLVVVNLLELSVINSSLQYACHRFLTAVLYSQVLYNDISVTDHTYDLSPIRL